MKLATEIVLFFVVSINLQGLSVEFVAAVRAVVSASNVVARTCGSARAMRGTSDQREALARCHTVEPLL